MSPENVTPRSPNAGELQQLANWLSDQGHEPDDVALTAQCAFIAVYDEYCTDSPGYVGKLMSVVWDGGPSFFDVFIWNDDSMVCVDRE